MYTWFLTKVPVQLSRGKIIFAISSEITRLLCGKNYMEKNEHRTLPYTIPGI